MVRKNDLDRLCRLSSKEFKPATDKIRCNTVSEFIFRDSIYRKKVRTS